MINSKLTTVAKSALPFICGLALVLALSFVQAGSSNLSEKPSGERERIVIVRDNSEPALCTALRIQAEQAVDRHETFCGLPVEGAGSELSRPHWVTLDPASIEPLLRHYLPLLGWDTRGVQTLIGQTMPQASREDLWDEHWRRYGEAMMATLESDPTFLQETVIDIDNDGETERVYRVAILRPRDKMRPELGWEPLPCNLPTGAPINDALVIPYRALMFDQDKWRHMGNLAAFDKIEGHDVFLFRGRSYLVSMSPSSVVAERVQVLKSFDEAFYSQACLIDRKL